MIKVTLSGHIQQFDCTFSICALRPGWKMPKISSFNHDILFRFPSFVLHIFFSQSFKKKNPVNICSTFGRKPCYSDKPTDNYLQTQSALVPFSHI